MRAFPEEKTKPSARLLWTQDTAGLHSLHTNKASPANRDPLDCIISLLRRIKTQVGTIEWCRVKMLRDLGVSGSSKQKPWHKRKVEWRGQEEVLGARMNCSMGMESDLRRKKWASADEGMARSHGSYFQNGSKLLLPAWGTDLHPQWGFILNFSTTFNFHNLK